MATYKGIKGFNIQTVSSDPPAPFAGQVWYNSTSATVKYFGIQAAVLGLQVVLYCNSHKRNSRSWNFKTAVNSFWW
jgi:hypothetical protein